MPDLPAGWTDDMNVHLPDGVSVEEVTDFVLGMVGRTNLANLLSKLQSAFGLSAEDADLVRDRVCGGVVRAATGNPINRPSREKDPFAWVSFGKATENPAIIKAMYPQFAPHLHHLKKPKAGAPARWRIRWPGWGRRPR